MARRCRLRGCPDRGLAAAPPPLRERPRLGQRPLGVVLTLACRRHRPRSESARAGRPDLGPGAPPTPDHALPRRRGRSPVEAVCGAVAAAARGLKGACAPPSAGANFALGGPVTGSDASIAAIGRRLVAVICPRRPRYLSLAKRARPRATARPQPCIPRLAAASRHRSACNGHAAACRGGCPRWWCARGRPRRGRCAPASLP